MLSLLPYHDFYCASLRKYSLISALSYSHLICVPQPQVIVSELLSHVALGVIPCMSFIGPLVGWLIQDVFHFLNGRFSLAQPLIVRVGF